MEVGAYLKGGGGGGVFDLAKMVASFLCKGLECKEEKFKNKKLGVMQPWLIQNKSALLTHE